MHENDRKEAPWMSIDDLKTAGAAVAADLKKAAGSGKEETKLSGTGGGSRHRGLPEDLRQRFIDVRAELFRRGACDPVLIRFDTATVDQAPTAAVADQLTTLVSNL
jgi:hypothetical protein